MNITEIKKHLGLSALNFTASKDAKWINHWNDAPNNKFVVSLPVDLLAIIKGNPAIDTLQVQQGILETSQGDIKSFRIINPAPREIIGTL